MHHKQWCKLSETALTGKTKEAWRRRKLNEERKRGICVLRREEELKYFLTACLSLRHQTICFIRFIFCSSNHWPHAALMMKHRGHWYNGSVRACAYMRLCVCVGLIWDVSVCRCNNKVHGARQRLPSLPQQHLCCLERERAVEGGGRESNRLSESERVADRFVCSPANSLSSKPVQYKTRLGEKCSKLYRKKSIREGLEKHGNVLKASPGSAEYSLKINK